MGKRVPNKTMTRSQVIRRALIIGALGFIAWLGLAYALWNILKLFGLQPDFWPMLEALSTAAVVAQFFGGGVVALSQLRDSADSRNLGIYNDLVEKLMSDETIEARRWIYLNLPDDPQIGLDGLNPDGQRHVKRVMNTLDHLGFLLEQDWITAEGEEAMIKWVSPFVVKVWAKLGPYISYEANRRHEPDYYVNIRLLAEECIAWRQTNLPEAQITWVDKAL
jgi:hypothetical protein